MTVVGGLASSALGLGAGGQKGNLNSYFPKLSGDGHVLAFESSSSNLSPDNLNGGYGIYVRDLDTGAVAFVAGNNPALSGDGRYVAFEAGNVYVRDLETGAQTLASRADGPNGTPANQASGFMNPSISADGTKVVFQTTTALDPVDNDAMPDIYLRDLSTDTTELISRATGAAGVKANDWSERPDISSNGRFVAFESEGYNLDPNDTEDQRDIFVRDLQADTTTHASPGVPQNARTLYPSISTDGRFVVYEVIDGNFPIGIYRRDRQLNTTDLVNAGASGIGPEYPVMSFDGRYVAFQTRAQLDPADTDAFASSTLTDVYVRDMQTGAISLASRASGADGSDGYGGNPAISGDGRFVAFGGGGPDFSPEDHDQVDDIYVRDLQDHVTSLESRASPGYRRYVRPRGATPLRVSLVPAAEPCTAPNNTHGAPLSFPSCSPPASASSLNLGVGDGSPALARSIGSVLLKAVGDAPSFPVDDADITIAFSLTNVMRASDLSDYTGELQGRVAIRITDKKNGPSAGEEGTVSDFDLAFTVPCVATESDPDRGVVHARDYRRLGPPRVCARGRARPSTASAR